MIASAKPGLTSQFAAALDWWRDAGVDGLLLDAPQCWLAEAEPPKEAAPAALAEPAPPVVHDRAPPPPKVVDRSDWPDSLAALAQWWQETPWFDFAPVEARVPPRGATGAKLMLLVPEPEREDGAELLSGPQGRLLDAMLAAMGIAADQTYRASILPRAMPHADWQALKEQGLGELALHHIGLAAPERLIVFGSHILPLLGHDPANNPASCRQIHQGGRTIPLLALRDLEVLLERPRWKAGVWQAWLDWRADGA